MEGATDNSSPCKRNDLYLCLAEMDIFRHRCLLVGNLRSPCSNPFFIRSQAMIHVPSSLQFSQDSVTKNPAFLLCSARIFPLIKKFLQPINFVAIASPSRGFQGHFSYPCEGPVAWPLILAAFNRHTVFKLKPDA